MFRSARRKDSPAGGSAGPDDALRALEVVATHMDRGKEALLAAVPRGRGAGAPLAEALAAFEEHLREALGSLQGWPPDTAGSERQAIGRALQRSLHRAEALRLEASPEGYEQLYALLGEILDPLDTLSEVADLLARGSR